MHDLANLTALISTIQALISDLKKSLESMRSREEYHGHGKLYMHSKYVSFFTTESQIPNIW